MSERTQQASSPASYLTEVFGLERRRAVVTGGTSGLGASSALALARAGAEVVISGRDEARGAEVVASIEEEGGAAAFLRCDVSDMGEIRDFASRVETEIGPVDILVNSAGIYLPGKGVDDSLEENVRAVWEVNFAGMMVMCQEFGRRMIERKYGRIVNLASISGLGAHQEGTAYGISKVAVIHLTKMLAAEWIKDGVNVNCIAPGDFETPLTADYAADPEYLAFLERVMPAGRMGQPAELDGAVLFLVSPMSGMVVGETLVVDGGMTVSLD